MSIDVQGYIQTTKAPWGKLFYRLVWNHLECDGKKILDFGSGLGITANHMAARNEVIAVEPCLEMVENRIAENHYTQLIGSAAILAQFPDSTFDVIICHNVLEYMDSRSEVMKEFVRLLKPEGYVSILKHHRLGKIMQKVVFDNRVDEAMVLLRNEDTESVNFGMICEYNEEELENYSSRLLSIEHVYGLRTFYALQRNEWKYDEEWQERMFIIETAVEDIKEFRDIAFFHHIIMKLHH